MYESETNTLGFFATLILNIYAQPLYVDPFYWDLSWSV